MLKIQIRIQSKRSIEGLIPEKLNAPALFFRRAQTCYLKNISSKNSRIFFEAELIVAG